MSALASEGFRASGCLISLIIIYLIVGLVVYGEPQGFSLTFSLVVILWPGALIWWSLYWVIVVIVLTLACLGIKHIWEGP